MLDTLIVNGNVVDGTGAPAQHAHLAIAGGRVVGSPTATSRPAGSSIADGLAVVTGFIDLHSHYGRAGVLGRHADPSCRHGVTTVIAGNCGLTLAPVAPHDRDYLTRLLARVEAIPVEPWSPGSSTGMNSYPEFLECRGIRPRSEHRLHGRPLRRAAGRDGGGASERGGHPDELAAMCELLSEAIAAGGMASRRPTWRPR